MQWRKKNSVDPDKWDKMVKPKNAKEIRAPKEYYDLFGANRT
jgi:hypothetical protein